MIPAVVMVFGMATGPLAEQADQHFGRFQETPRPLPTIKDSVSRQREEEQAELQRLRKEVVQRLAEDEKTC